MHLHFYQCIICYDVTVTFTVRSLFVSVYCACLLWCILYRMITVMTNSLLNTKFKLNTSSVPWSEQASPYSFLIHCLSKRWCILQKLCRNCLYRWHHIHALYTWWHQCFAQMTIEAFSVLILNELLSEDLPFPFGINVACVLHVYCEYGPIQMYITRQSAGLGSRPGNKI